MTKPKDIAELENLIGVEFKNKSLLAEALTHPSLGHRGTSYERLEFLGDSVLGMIAAEMIFKAFPGEDEGKMTKRLSGLVCGETLLAVAQKLKLGEYLLMSESEEAAGGGNNATTLENALESLVGAIYLDQGFVKVRKFVTELWKDLMLATLEPPRDPKTALQEWAQSKALPLPVYTVIFAEGPAHSTIFTVQAEVTGFPPQTGSGNSKKRAEREAAEKLIGIIERPHHPTSLA